MSVKINAQPSAINCNDYSLNKHGIIPDHIDWEDHISKNTKYSDILAYTYTRHTYPHATVGFLKPRIDKLKVKWEETHINFTKDIVGAALDLLPNPITLDLDDISPITCKYHFKKTGGSKEVNKISGNVYPSKKAGTSFNALYPSISQYDLAQNL
ncbi:hypothetical protein [Pseudemcibacter aquimaris]|uniref:hypothetical protein n=1 Tax=Pseudemcibacter aquimaris TaxID=2857064 RepID=UPI002013554F|nr:hypothetical protein [Pseudemcibacter aquimaris]MCC3861494.1 hypothetical protein [Pseudemcibacter aquimaris]WDU58263.1 hypothetical protein KW060_13815 [Pseudemcibacter aquimaris]